MTLTPAVPSRPARRCVGLALAVLLCLPLAVVAGPRPAAATSVTAEASPARTLRYRVNRALQGSTAGALGVHVVVGGLGTVVSRNGTSSFQPASTQKMYVGLTTMLKLTPRRRLVTAVRVTGRQDADGVLHGHVVLRGTGDPGLTKTHLGQLARAVRSQGIHTVNGGLYGDDGHFDRARRAPGWKTSFVPVESGPLSSVVVNRNRWRKDSAYIREPVLPNLGLFRRALADAGVRVAKPSYVGRPGATSRVLVTHASATVGAIVRSMLKNSDNMTAELLLKKLGRTAGAGTTARGASVVRAQMQSLGVRLGTFADGSGLSRYDRQTPAGEVALLRAAEKTEVGTAFRTSLARACVDGTLEDRMCGTAAAGRVYAKTGTLDRVRVLSGYTTTRSGRPVWFSFMLAGCGNGLSCRRAIDRAVVQLAAFGA
jgi:serine-type D-Ala-D-Ala carboxypeptidase/endopeptidase (penicillin-binding protein 4)